MSKKARTRGKAAPGVNPQGYGQDKQRVDTSPKSDLEARAKFDNTKR
ncbi:small, acid-soluble spore protein L [Bacillus sp. HMF5848]|nr:small, acid-soluble spore protein L [Bacillus sp. HMF5848]RSK27327.1 small, acid-soluble spore protein L [Bacillus sp. HMF5848]